MLRIDKRNPEEAANLIRWAQRDEFWIPNMLSMDTLRSKFDQLSLKKSQDSRGSKNPHVAQPLPSDYEPESKRIRRELAQEAATQ